MPKPKPEPWITVKDAYDGIEKYLLAGPKGLSWIAAHAFQHGMSTPRPSREVPVDKEQREFLASLQRGLRRTA